MAASMKSFGSSWIFLKRLDQLYSLCAVQMIHNSVRATSYDSGKDPRKVKYKPVRVNKEPKILAKLFFGSKKRSLGDERMQETSSEEAEFNFSVKSENPRKKYTSRGRAEHLSNVFGDHVMSMIASGEAAPELLGKGIEFSKINLKHDIGVLQIHWITSGSNLRDDEIQQLLDHSKGKIRYGLNNYRFVGYIPEIEFIPDRSHCHSNEMTELLQNADKGPKEHGESETQQSPKANEPVPPSLSLRDRINLDFANLPLSMKNLGKDQLNYEELDIDHHPHQQQQQQAQVKSEAIRNGTQTRYDIFGLNREEMLMKIRKKLRSKMALDEMTQWNEEEASRFRKSFAKMKKLDQIKPPKGSDERLLTAAVTGGHAVGGLSSTTSTEAMIHDEYDVADGDWIQDDEDDENGTGRRG